MNYELRRAMPNTKVSGVWLGPFRFCTDACRQSAKTVMKTDEYKKATYSEDALDEFKESTGAESVDGYCDTCGNRLGAAGDSE